MGQRSQIYIRLKEKEHTPQLIALFFPWNYGVGMVSRARGIIEDVARTRKAIGHLRWLVTEKLAHLCTIDFDIKDAALTTDLIKEYLDFDASAFDRKTTANDSIFNSDNNDGKLFIDIDKNTGEIKYAFTDCNNAHVMTPEEYLIWDLGFAEDYPDWITLFHDKNDYFSDVEKTISFTRDNIETIHRLAGFMSEEEVEEIINDDYKLEPQLKESIERFIENVDGAERAMKRKDINKWTYLYYIRSAAMIVSYLLGYDVCDGLEDLVSTETDIKTNEVVQGLLPVLKKIRTKIRFLPEEEALEMMKAMISMTPYGPHDEEEEVTDDDSASGLLFF